MTEEKKFVVAEGNKITAKLLPSQVEELDRFKGNLQDALADTRKEMALLNNQHPDAVSLPPALFDMSDAYIKAIESVVQSGQIEISPAADGRLQEHTLSGAGYKRVLSDSMRAATEVQVPDGLSVAEEAHVSDAAHILKGNISLLGSFSETIREEMDNIAREALQRTNISRGMR